jgi:hypothetical protein
VLKKNIWANFQRIIELFTQKLSLSSQKYGFGIRDPEKTYSGSRGQKGAGSRIRIRNMEGSGSVQIITDPDVQNLTNPEHCFQVMVMFSDMDLN